MSQTHKIISRDEVVNNPGLIGSWIEQQLLVKKLPKSEGCALAKKEFGDGHPFSDSYINKLPQVQEYKNFIYQANASKKRPPQTKKEILAGLGKLPKSFLVNVLSACQSTAHPMHETIAFMLNDDSH